MMKKGFWYKCISHSQKQQLFNPSVHSPTYPSPSIPLRIYSSLYSLRRRRDGSSEGKSSDHGTHAALAAYLPACCHDEFVRPRQPGLGEWPRRRRLFEYKDCGHPTRDLAIGFRRTRSVVCDGSILLAQKTARKRCVHFASHCARFCAQFQLHQSAPATPDRPLGHPRARQVQTPGQPDAHPSSRITQDVVLDRKICPFLKGLKGPLCPNQSASQPGT